MKQLTFNGDLTTEIKYTISSEPVYEKSYYEVINRQSNHRVVVTSVDDFVKNLRNGYAVNAVCKGGRMAKRLFENTPFICMDFDDLRIPFKDFRLEMENGNIPPTFIHTSFSDNTKVDGDGVPIRKYHCYWIFPKPLDCYRKNLYTDYLMDRLAVYNPDPKMGNRVQWCGGMFCSRERELTELEKCNGSCKNAVLYDFKYFDSLIADGDYVSRRTEFCEETVENCYEGEFRSLFLPIGIDYGDTHCYVYKGEEGEVRGRVKRDEYGNLVSNIRCDGEHRRIVLYAVCCQFRINGGNDDNVRAGFNELLFNLKGFSAYFIEEDGDKVNEEELATIVDSVLDIPFEELRRSEGLKGKVKVDANWLRRLNERLMAEGKKKIHHNTVIAEDRNKRIYDEIMGIMNGYAVKSLREALAILEKRMEISMKTLRRIDKRYGVVPKEELSDKVLAIMRDDPSITLKEMADSYDMPLITVKRIVKRLVNDGKLIRRGGKKCGIWELTI